MKPYLPLLGLGLLLAACERQPSPTPKNNLPKASFTAPDSLRVGQAGTFTNTSTQFGTATWLWGDGSYPLSLDSVSQTSLYHAYYQPRRYRVSLSVKNRYGTDTISKVIRVVEPHLSTTSLNSFAGSYYGRLTTSYFRMPPATPIPGSVRDTLIQVVVVNNKLLAVPTRFGFPVPFYEVASTTAWSGLGLHQANYLFRQTYTADSRTQLQVAQAGDSLFFTTRNGGLGAYDSFVFYGKKR